MGRCQDRRRPWAPVAHHLRSARHPVAWWGLLLLVCLLVPQTVGARDSTPVPLGPPAPVGYAAPADVGPLLEYRLPAWGWRTLEAGFQFSYHDNGLPEESVRDLDLNSRWRHHFESESRAWDLEFQFRGSSLEGPPIELSDASRNGETADLEVAGSLDQYVSENVAVRSGLRTGYFYRDLTSGEGDEVSRSASFSPTLGLAWGRLRNVGPLLRAQRLSERLVALGRPALGAEQVQATARLFAQHSGFATVYDRADKQFWGQVLDNLPLAEPLTPWEVMFLAEVLDEVYGNRLEGVQFAAAGRSWHRGGTYHPKPAYGGDLTWSYYHNTSLNTQWLFYAKAERRWDEGGAQTIGYVGAEHLWNIADRTLWTNRIWALYSDSRYGGQLHDVERRLTASTQWNYYVEDTLVLSPGVELLLTDTPYRDYVNWDVFVRVAWFFDRALY